MDPSHLTPNERLLLAEQTIEELARKYGVLSEDSARELKSLRQQVQALNRWKDKTDLSIKNIEEGIKSIKDVLENKKMTLKKLAGIVKDGTVITGLAYLVFELIQKVGVKP